MFVCVFRYIKHGITISILFFILLVYGKTSRVKTTNFIENEKQKLRNGEELVLRNNDSFQFK